MADPVSWLMIEPGWKVLASDGSEIGRVEEVTGDSGNDIFNGLSIATGILARPRYVPAEEVAEITEGAVRLALGPAEVEKLGEFEEPPTSAEIEPDRQGFGDRLAAPLRGGVDERSRRVSVWRRIGLWLGLGGRR